MKKIIIALIFAGLTTAGFAQSTRSYPSVKKTDSTKTMVVKKHKTMHDQKMATMHNKNKEAWNAPATTSSTGSHPADTTRRGTNRMRHTSKMHSKGTLMDSTSAYKKNSKLHK